MKLNKSFTVKRSIKKPRERVMALRHLSSYIYQSVVVDGSSVWIAQGEGRAKDGRDITQPAIIKMISMSKPKEMSLSDFVRSLNIVPVTISYEYDPCDADKARELYIREKTGSYQKSESEDFNSILKGIRGYKGHVHVAFGTPLIDDYSTPQAVAKAIDDQIIPNYQVRPCHVAAAEALKYEFDKGHYTQVNREEREYFEERMSKIPEEYRPVALATYANVIILQEENAAPING